MSLDPQVVLLIGADTALVDESSHARALTPVGNVARTTAEFKYGAGSITFDGTGDRIQVPNHDDFQFGTGDFTVEAWVRFLGKADSQAIFGQWGALGNSWFLYVTGGVLTFTVGGTLGWPFVPTLGVWYHLAVDKLSGLVRLYINGTAVANASLALGVSTEPITIGAIGVGGTYPAFDFNGQMDEVRITKGLARYAGSFTPPATAFPRTTHTYADWVIADGASHYWRLGEASGLVATDLVGGKHGAISGGVTLGAAGAVAGGDGAMGFDGVDGQVKTLSITIPLAATVEGWMKFPALGVVKALIGTRFEAGATGDALNIGAYTTGVPYVQGHSGADVFGTAVMSAGGWHHVVYVFTASTVSFYVDGAFDRTQPLVRAAPNVTTALIAILPGVVAHNGSLDEIALYPRALTAAEIAAHYHLGRATFPLGSYPERVLLDGASNYWRLNEASGTVADDVIGGADGTISGGVTLGAAGAVAGGDGAMGFDGVSGKVQTAAAVAVPQAVTIEGWVKRVTTGAYGVIFSTRNPDASGAISVLLGATNAIEIYSNAAFITGVRVVTDGLWHHIAFVGNGTTGWLYVDGVLDKTNAFSRIAHSQLASLGSEDAGGNFLNGALDEVALYPRALTPAEIAAHYALRTFTGGPDLGEDLNTQIYVYLGGVGDLTTLVSKNLASRSGEMTARMKALIADAGGSN